MCLLIMTGRQPIVTCFTRFKHWLRLHASFAMRDKDRQIQKNICINRPFILTGQFSFSLQAHTASVYHDGASAD